MLKYKIEVGMKIWNCYKTRRGNHRLMISPSHFAVAVASVGGQATVTDRMVYVLLTWWDGLAPSCFDRYWFHLWPNLRLPPDAGGIFLNAAGIFPGYFRLVSSVRCLFLSACRSSLHPGFSRAASVAFGLLFHPVQRTSPW